MTAPVAMGRRLAAWFGASVNRRILGAALLVGGLSSLVKVTAMAKELAIAYRFGTGSAVDAFLIAYLVPQLVVNVVAGSLPAAFTPAYIEVRERHGIVEARRLVASVSAGSLAMLLVLTAVLLVAVPAVLPLLGSGFDATKLRLTRSLFLLLSPVVLLNGLVTLWTAILNAEHRYTALALAPIGVPLVTLMLVLVAGQSWGIYALALGTVLGFVTQCVLLASTLARRGLSLVPRWSGLTPGLRRVSSQYLPMVAGAALATGSWAIGQAMAAMLPAGSVASLNYGNRVVGMVSEIGSTALATAILPHFAEMVARHNWPGIRRTLWVYGRFIVGIGVPATVLLILASHPIVRLLYQRGAFTAADTQLVAAIQSLYLAQLPFVMIGMLYVRLASALRQNGLLLGGALITLPLNAALNLVFMRRLGVAGIALSTTLTYVVSCVYLAVTVRRALAVQARDGA